MKPVDPLDEQEALEGAEKPYDSSDPASVNDARKGAGRKKRARLEFVKAMLDLPEGRKWLWELMEKCYIFGNPVIANDPYATYFNLGQQNVGKLLLQDSQQFPEEYAKMCNEARNRK